MINTYFHNIFSRIEAKHPNELELNDAARDVIESLTPVFEEHNDLMYEGILENIIEQNMMMDLILPQSKQGIEGSGHGLVYFINEMLADKGVDMVGKTALVSGSDTFALSVMTKLKMQGVKVLACSDEGGVIHDPYGVDLGLVEAIKSLPDGSLSQYMITHPDAIYIKNPSALWAIPCEIAMACAMETPLAIEDAKKLVQGGCIALAEGRKLVTQSTIIDYLMTHEVLFMPLKATAAVEPSHDTELDLQNTMKAAFMVCKSNAAKYGYKNHLSYGANIASFERVRQALI